MNVLWIVMDALRRDRLGCYGYQRNTSPNLDRFAAEAVVFDQMVSPHIPTHPAHTTLFSGRDVFDHGVVAQGGKQEPPDDLRLLPAVLREHGYYTAAVDNIGRWIKPAFERYEEYPRWSHDGSLPWRNGEEVTARADEILTEAAERKQPYFLFLHYWDPHSPYLPPPPYDRMFYSGNEKDRGNRSMDPVWRSEWFATYFREWLDGVTDIEFVKSQYDASIAYSDACVGKVFERAAELGLWEDTLVIVQGDHGEELDEHGCWFDHHGLYDTNVLVPFLFRPAGGVSGGRRVPSQTSFLDVVPTVLESLEFPALLGDLPGAPLQPRFSDRAEDGEREVVPGVYLTECTWMRKRGWRTGEWKLIEALEPDIYNKPSVELFHLPSDPGEQVNLADQRPDVVTQLRAERDRYVADRLAATGAADPLEAQARSLRIHHPRFIAGREQRAPLQRLLRSARRAIFRK